MAKDPTEMISKYLQKKKAVRELTSEPSLSEIKPDEPVAAQPPQKRKKERKRKSSGDAPADAPVTVEPKLTRKKSKKSLSVSEETPVAPEPASVSTPQDEPEKRTKKPRHSAAQKKAAANAAAASEPSELPAAPENAGKKSKRSKKASAEETTNEPSTVEETPADEAPKVVKSKKAEKVRADEPASAEKPAKKGRKAKAVAGGLSKQWLVEPEAGSDEKAAEDNDEASPVISQKRKTRSSGPVAEPAETTPKATKASSRTSKKSKPTPAPAAEPSDSDEEGAGDDEKEVETAEGADEEEEFMGFGTDDDDEDEDSSDDEDLNFDSEGIDVSKLPTIAKDDATVKRKLEKAKRQPTEDRGVIYLGRIPHGFYEAQMKGYFSQFGDVTRVRLSRNKKTGRSKHYGFIEFESSSVAQIVAETMDNYLLTGHILTCKVIPKDQVHPELWVGANRKWRVVPRDRVARVQHNKPRTEEEQEHAEERLLRRQSQKKRKLEEAGIKYDFDAVAYKKRPKSAKA